MIHNLKTVVKGDEGSIRRMAPPEREAHLARQRSLLRGIDINGPLEPAHGLYDLCASMIEKNEISYISPTRCLSRQQELAGAKPDKELQLDATKTTLILKEQQPKLEISVASDLALYQAMQRRSLALDLTNLVSYEVMRSWMDRLFALYSQTPAPGFVLTGRPLSGLVSYTLSQSNQVLALGSCWIHWWGNYRMMCQLHTSCFHCPCIRQRQVTRVIRLTRQTNLRKGATMVRMMLIQSALLSRSRTELERERRGTQCHRPSKECICVRLKMSPYALHTI